MKKPPLPSYETYRKDFLNKGVSHPLKPINTPEQGMLEVIGRKAEKKGWPWDEQVDPTVYDEKITWPKITVVSPSYNQGIYLEETIRSVLLQNYPNIEYIIMDGKSNDESTMVIQQYEQWVSYWESEKDRGQGHAINKGFSLASGDIYCWLNSDDLFTKGALYQVALAFVKTGATFVYGNCLDLKDGVFKPYWAPIKFDRNLPIPGQPQPSTFWSKRIHQPIWEELYGSLDFELWMRIAKGAKKKFINHFLAIARQHDEAKTHSQDEKSKLRWQEDHHKQWTVHQVDNWNRLNRENQILQRFLRIFPFLKQLF